MIFNREPNTWQELQDFVGQLFSEIGLDVEVSKTVELARGKKEIDVFVKDIGVEYQPTFLIECKNWNKAVNQETVHAFHTVVNGFGANFGFIVAKNGFQKGCYEAAEKTNIQLVSLNELEERYYERWLRGMISQYIPLSDKLFPYWDPTGGRLPKHGKKLNWNTQKLIDSAYEPIRRIGPSDEPKDFRVRMPIALPVINDNFEIIDHIEITNVRDYFNFVESNKEKALFHYQKFYGEV